MVYVPSFSVMENVRSRPGVTFSISPWILPFLSRISNSVTASASSLVTWKVAGPAVADMSAGSQPFDVSVASMVTGFEPESAFDDPSSFPHAVAIDAMATTSTAMVRMGADDEDMGLLVCRTGCVSDRLRRVRCGPRP